MPLRAEVMTVSEVKDWSTSTPMTAASFAEAAAVMESKMEPPQEKMTSVPFLYQPEARVCSSAEGWKLSPYFQV